MAIGTTLGELETGGWCNTAILNDKLIHVDWATENFSRSPMARLHVFGHIKILFTTLINAFSHRRKKHTIGGMKLLDTLSPSLGDYRCANKRQKLMALSQVANAKDGTDNDIKGPLIKPQLLMRALPKRLPDNTHYYIDARNAWAWATHLLHLRDSEAYQIGMGFGAMAWAIGASIGASIGRQKKGANCLYYG